MPRFTNPVTLAMRAAKTAAGLAAAEQWASDQARTRTEAAKPGLLEALDALRVEADNLAGAIEAGHVFDVRAVEDAVRSVLMEIQRAEARVVREAGLEVSLRV